MRVEFDGKLVDGKFTLNRPSVWKAYLSGLKDGNYFITIEKSKGPLKTHPQLGYFHGIVVMTIYNQIIDYGWDRIPIRVGNQYKEIPLTTDMVVELLKSHWAEKRGVKVKSKKYMTKEEFSQLIDDSIMFGAEKLSCVIPPPEDK